MGILLAVLGVAAGLLLLGAEVAPVAAPDLSMRLSRSFTLAELVASRTATVRGIDNTPTPADVERLRALAQRVLQPLRDAIGAPLRVTSGYRSAELNAAVGGSDRSQHMTGQAADLVTDGLSSLELLEVAQAAGIPWDQAITYDDAPHLHLSYSDSPRRQVLRRVNGAYQVIR